MSEGTGGLFLTQGASLDLFFRLSQEIRRRIPLERIGIYAADSRFFKDFKSRFPEIESEPFRILKEWEIIRDSRVVTPDLSALSDYERRFGYPFLWNALVADRRIYFGKKYAYDQDYKPRYGHDRMMAILQTGLQRMERFFDDVRPRFVVAFQCITLGEYLAFLLARARGIHFFDLRPTRILNYFFSGESVLEPSERLQSVYARFLSEGIEPALRDKAKEFVEGARSTHALYEGVIPPSHKPPTVPRSIKQRSPLRRAKKLGRQLAGELRYRFGEERHDNHVSGYLGPLLAKLVVRPWRARRMDRLFRRVYVRRQDLSGLDYAFFPLHTEPEVTLNVYSKPYLNQIEAVRLFSHNLPVGMKVVVKEHPWSVGKRPLSYYRKLLEIPNVRLAHPGLTSRELIASARLITVIAGSIGFEGLILRKPVVVLGRTPFNFLPPGMIRYAQNPDRLGFDVRELLERHADDEEALLSYVAAVMRESVPIDFYSKLLGRKGVFSPTILEGGGTEDEVRLEHIARLAEYLVDKLG